MQSPKSGQLKIESSSGLHHPVVNWQTGGNGNVDLVAKFAYDAGSHGTADMPLYVYKVRHADGETFVGDRAFGNCLQ